MRGESVRSRSLHSAGSIGSSQSDIASVLSSVRVSYRITLKARQDGEGQTLVSGARLETRPAARLATVPGCCNSTVEAELSAFRTRDVFSSSPSHELTAPLSQMRGNEVKSGRGGK